MSQPEFVINITSVSCPACQQVFATQTPFKLPDMNVQLPVEADLHRVLPYGAIRSALVTICPQCQYAWWTNTFNRHFFLPFGISETPTIDYAKKFAHAVFTGRKNNFHVLDRALLALNGYWCAKESHQETGKWLALAIQELAGALANTKWQGNRARYHYVIAELLRLNGQFEQALIEFDRVDSSSSLPEELISNQRSLANRENADSVLLTNEQVEEIFFPTLAKLRKQAADSTKQTQSTEFNANSKTDFMNSIKNSSLPPRKGISLELSTR